MERTTIYGVVGCFLATAFSVYLNKFQSNTVLLILIPMWGLVIGIAVARVVNSREEVNISVPRKKTKEIVLYSKKKK